MDRKLTTEGTPLDFRLGVGVEEITPEVGVPLSGFIARQNRPSTKVDSGLYVRVIGLQGEAGYHFLFNFDLLGINSDLEAKLLAKLEDEIGIVFRRENCLFTATHTHSGPALGLLVGEQLPDPYYIDLIAKRAARAARTALATLQFVNLYSSEVRIPGLTYNRRALLPDGRVSISPTPDLPVVERDAIDDRATILLWRDLQGKNVAALLHYACHGVAVLSQAIGGDIPGELAAGVGKQLGAPCLFLQGAAGDVNPTTVTATWADLVAWVERAMEHLKGVNERFRPRPGEPFRTLSAQLPLYFMPLPSLREAEDKLQKLERIASGDFSALDLQAEIAAIKNTLNLPPREALDPDLGRFVAKALAQAGRNTLSLVQSGESLPSRSLMISAWRLGDIVLVFLACELFSTTGLRIRSLSSRRKILPVSYLSPLVGYVPTAEAIKLGGYEVDDAWRYYGQPAPFEPDSEQRILLQTSGMMIQLLAA